MTETTIKIEGMSCGHCVARVEKALKGIEGVTDAKVDLGEKKADIEFDPSKADEAKLKEAIEDVGYTVKG